MPKQPTKDEAKQLVAGAMGELMTMFTEQFGHFIAGKRFHFLGFPPGAYPPANDGLVRDRTAFENPHRYPERFCFSVTDDQRAMRSPYFLWTFDPDPNFSPLDEQPPPEPPDDSGPLFSSRRPR